MAEDTTRYYKDPAKLIFELMQDTFRDRINTYFLGSPAALAASAYPCIVVQQISGNNTVQNAATGQDYVTSLINIHIMFVETMSAVSQGTTDTTMRKLDNYVQGRDPATGFYMNGTVLHALRTNLEIYNPTTNLPTTIDHDIDINFDVTPTADKAIMEAIITVKTVERISVPDRIIG